MIGVDTNVLLRAVLDDDLEQSAIARTFLEQASQVNKLFISSFAILEMVWVLRVKKRTRKQICEAILDLIDSPGITIGNREVIIKALEHYAQGNADFGDYMILSEGELMGSKQMVSFDQALFEELKSVRNPKEISF